MSADLFKLCIHAVDGERFYVAGGPARDELLAFLQRYDHEGSSVWLEWVSTRDDDTPVARTDDPERVYRILAGREEPSA